LAGTSGGAAAAIHALIGAAPVAAATAAIAAATELTRATAVATCTAIRSCRSIAAATITRSGAGAIADATPADFLPALFGPAAKLLARLDRVVGAGFGEFLRRLS
jgi:hypothetical protein